MVAPSHLKSFQALEAALRTGSLKQAAELLAITPAAVGQRIKALEEYLGIDLLVRGRSGLSPTPALAAALGPLSDAFRALEEAAGILDLHRGHEIHIAAASDFAELWLQPRLERFRAAQPNTLFCINGEGDAPMRLGAVDCTISFQPRTEAPHTDELFRDFVIPISSPENTRRVAQLPRKESLEGFPLLHVDFYKEDGGVPDWREWIVANGLRRTAPERGIRFQRIVPAVEAVRADAGFALCGLALLSDLVDEGALSLLFPISTGAWSDFAFTARFRGDALSRPQVRRFRAWLAEEARATRAWLRGVASGDEITARADA